MIRSTAWASEAKTGVAEHTTRPGGSVGMLIEGDRPGRNVFQLTVADLAAEDSVYIKVPFGSTALINVTGTEAYANPGMYEIRFYDWTTDQFVQLSHPLADRPDLNGLRRSTLWNFRRPHRSRCHRTWPGRAASSRRWRRSG